jgi:hypothetical protein
VTTDPLVASYLDEPREVRLDRWQRQAEMCREAGRADLVAICKREIDALAYGGERIDWSDGS